MLMVGRCDRAANEARICAEPASPDCVRQDGDGLTLIGRSERSAQRGFRAEHLEAAGSGLASQRLIIGKREPVKIDGLHAVEDMLFPAPKGANGKGRFLFGA